MGSKAYAEWIKIFDDKIAESYKTERNELQKVAMLITGLQIELKNVNENFELQYTYLQQRLKDKDVMEQKLLTADNSFCQVEKDPAQLQTESALTDSTNGMSLDHSDFSPDIFKNNLNKPIKDISSNSLVIDLSISDESAEDIGNIQESPTLTSKRKKPIVKLNKNQSDIIKRNIFKNIDKENSHIIDCTPEIFKKKNETSPKKSKKKNIKLKGHIGDLWLSKKKEESTITQLFSNMNKNNSSCNSLSAEVDTPENDKTFKDWIKGEDTSEMGITKLLSYINKEDTPNTTAENNQDEEMDSTQEIDEFSKALLFEESPSKEESSPKKKLKVDPLIEPVVRGNAKKQLKGFSCAECRDFYGNANLSPKKMQKLLDACSKHRYKYKPPEDTYPGIWDMTIPEENAKK